MSAAQRSPRQEESGLPERFTQKEVSRIAGIETGRLRYWQRLRLVEPRSRWGERFYSFGDLVALRSIKEITERRIPARKLCRAVARLRSARAERPYTIGELRLFASGREIAAIPPGSSGLAFEPLTGQFVLPFHNAPGTSKIHKIQTHSAEELFAYAVRRETEPGGFGDAIRVYRQVIAIEPGWCEPHLNLGCIYYQLGELENARQAFDEALELAPGNAIGHFNLGCVLDELGELEGSVEHLRRATEIVPEHADAHFNLAAAYEKRGEKRLALQHWIQYLKHQPRGPWADYARTRLQKIQARQAPPSPPIPFPSPN